MPSQLEMHVETYMCTYSGCSSGRCRRIASSPPVASMRFCFWRLFPITAVFPPPPPPSALPEQCIARRFTTSMLWMLISIPANAERYSFLLLSFISPSFGAVRTRTRHSMATMGFASTRRGRFGGERPHWETRRRARRRAIPPARLVVVLDAASSPPVRACARLDDLDFPFLPLLIVVPSALMSCLVLFPPPSPPFAISAPMRASRTLLSSFGGSGMTNARFFKISMISSSSSSSPPPAFEAESGSFFGASSTSTLASSRSSSGDMSANRFAGYCGTSHINSDRSDSNALPARGFGGGEEKNEDSSDKPVTASGSPHPTKGNRGGGSDDSSDNNSSASSSSSLDAGCEFGSGVLCDGY
mmetsp:Transcript_24588/g.59275  ORF Transcript_24588/g.59275 Transcript_24588/m.59275 type:complete len:358 (+) Transcript_24588:287-1360(+)